MNAEFQAQLQALVQQQQEGPKAHVEFLAGMLTKKSNGTTITADPRRGKVRIIHGPDSELLLQWLLRPSGKVEFERTLYPGVKFEGPIQECKDGRVFILRLDRQNVFFFWMQEVAADKDAEICKKVNDLIANPPVDPSANFGGMGAIQDALSGRPSRRHAPSGGASAGGASAGSNIAGGSGSFVPPGMGDYMDDGELDPATIMRMFGAGVAAPSPAPTSAPAAAAASTPSVRPSNTSAPAAPARPAAPASSASTSAAPGANPQFSADAVNLFKAMAAQLQQQQQQQESGPGLDDILDADRVIPLLTPDMIATLSKLLPEGQQTEGALKQQLRSAQLKQTLARMSAILQSEQFGPLMASLGLPVTGEMGVTGFLNAVQAAADKERAAAPGASAGAAAPPGQDGNARMDDSNKP